MNKPLFINYKIAVRWVSGGAARLSAKLWVWFRAAAAVAACTIIFQTSTLPAFATTGDTPTDDLVNGLIAPAYNPKFDPCGAGTGSAPDPNGAVHASKTQDDNARTIIGIAKTLNVGKQGALIGLMVGITESHLSVYANSTIPISMQNPVWLAIPTPPARPLGHDHDSVGVFQQRVSSGWSTFGDGTSKEIVWQLMDTAYGAEAFFGIPPGTKPPDGLKQPSALQKGLQHYKNWAVLDPWVAAQLVQVSFDRTGGNYKASMPAAQGFLDRLWDSSPAIPLPIPINGGGAGSNEVNTTTPTPVCTTVGAALAVGGSLKDIILAYAKPDYHPPNFFDLMPAYDAAIQKAQCINAYNKPGCKKEYVGGGAHPGVDCGGFVTRAMRDSGTDPQYNKYQEGTILQEKYMKDNPSLYKNVASILGHKVTSSAGLQFGDIAMVNTAADNHTFIYVGNMDPNFHGNIASASISTTGRSWRSPMAGPFSNYSQFTWYRLVK